MKISLLFKNFTAVFHRYCIRFVILFYFLLNAAGAWSQQKYNVIFISMDDLSIAFQTYGNTFAPTPNIQRLAQHGVLFKNVYTQYSLCSPSRTSTFSGMRVTTTQIVDNEDSIRKALGPGFRFLPEYFHDHGYRTESYGKFICNHDYEVSWDYFIDETKEDGFASGDDEDNTSLAGKPPGASPGRQEPIWFIDTVHKKISGTDDGKETDELIKVLKKPVSVPFFYNLGLQTHNFFTPILSYWNQAGDHSVSELLPVDSGFIYTNVYGNGSANIPLPVSPPDDTADVPDIALKYLYQYTPDAVQRLRHAYYSEITQADANIGKVLDQLDALDLWKNSVVVFWSDHGLSMGEHDGMWLKIDMFEECLRIPMIICAPGIKPGVCNRLVESIDLFQTLAELCNIPATGKEGSSLVPLLEKPDIEWKKAMFSNLQKNNGDTLLATAVRTENWHYNNWQEEGEELYDMVNDPYEITNLAKNHAYVDTLNKMRSLLTGGWKAVLPPVYPSRLNYRDEDKDGFGSKTDMVRTYFGRDGYIENSGDCNDKDPGINPLASETRCNGMDDNCNGFIDENNPVVSIIYSGETDLCKTDNIVLTAISTDSGGKYQWLKNEEELPGENKTFFNPFQIGYYQVAFTDTAGCRVLSDTVGVSESCSKDKKLILFPNPSDGNFTVFYSAAGQENLRLDFYNSVGQKVYSESRQAIAGLNVYKFNLSYRLKPDIYILKLNNDLTVRFAVVR